MPISLVTALGLDARNIRLAIVGAGGKTTALFRISRQLPAPVVMTTTTHILNEQSNLADECWICNDSEVMLHALGDMEFFPPKTIFICGGETDDGRLAAVSDSCQELLLTECARRNIPLLVEADGARGLALKAPAEHEPAIPEWVNAVLVVAGLQGLNQPLNEDTVHRVERFSELSGLSKHELVTPRALEKILSHLEGGLKRIPSSARKLLLLNQADNETLLGQAKGIAETLIGTFDCVAIGSLLPEEDMFDCEIEAVYVPVASVILAAGGSLRLGQPKALLQWKGETMVHRAARIALEAGLSPVIVVAGAEYESISAVLKDLEVTVIENAEWEEGQSTSVKLGLSQVPPRNGAVIFQVVDQPGLSVDLLWGLVELHRQTRAPIIQPYAMGTRSNPVLFDRAVFPNLMTISGDQGGRAIFHQFSVMSLPWHDTGILIDLDTPDDLEKLDYLD